MDIIVFDIGGTWFRSGLFTSDGTLVSVKRVAAMSYKNTAYTDVRQLQRLLVNYIVAEVQRLSTVSPSVPSRSVGISIGACINAHTGLILNSGPLWGAECLPFDLLAELYSQSAHFTWTIVNDVTAALLRYIAESEGQNFARITLITVSTGIACRTYDTPRRVIPVDRLCGIQGEIGHLPVAFAYQGTQIELRCDCGGQGHLNAFCSGRGITALLPLLATKWNDDFSVSLLSRLAQGRPEELCFEHFITAVTSNDDFALRILDAVTLPIAHMILHLLTFDPEVECVLLTGGVVASLEVYYLNSLQQHLSTIGLYQLSACTSDFFDQRVRAGILDDHSGLIGAALAVQASAAPMSNKA